MKARVVVQIARFDEVLGALVTRQDLSEELRVTRLDHKLHVRHERVAKLYVQQVQLGQKSMRLLLSLCLLHFERFSFEPSKQRGINHSLRLATPFSLLMRIALLTPGVPSNLEISRAAREDSDPIINPERSELESHLTYKTVLCRFERGWVCCDAFEFLFRAALAMSHIFNSFI